MVPLTNYIRQGSFRHGRLQIRREALPHFSSAATPSDGLPFLYTARTLLDNEMNYKKGNPSEGVAADEK